MKSASERNVLWTAAAAITAGVLLFLANLFSEYLFPGEEDGEIVRLGLGLVYIAAYGLGAVALVVALRGLSSLQRGRGELTRAGNNGLRVATVGAAFQALFAAVYFATAAATGDAADAAFFLYALGFLLLIGGSITTGVSMLRTGADGRLGGLLLLTAAAAIVTIVTPAPAHDVGLFLFDAAWIGIGLALAGRRPSPVSMKRVATMASIFALAATLVPAAGANGPGPHTDLTCGDTITTDTKLDSELANCPGSGIVIGADNITLDLDGHTVDGTGDGAGVDNSAGHDGVRIERGTVTGFAAGVLLIGAIGNLVQNLRISDNAGAGLALIQSSRNRVEHNRVSANGFDGIFLFDSSAHNVVKKNSTARNGEAGIALLEGSNYNRVEENVASSNLVVGIGLGGVVGNHIENNAARANGFVGIVLEASNGNQVERNLRPGTARSA